MDGCQGGKGKEAKAPVQFTRMPKLSLIQNACYRIVIVVLKTPFSCKLNGSFHYPDAGQRTRGKPHGAGRHPLLLVLLLCLM